MTFSRNMILAISCLAMMNAGWSGCSHTPPKVDLSVEKIGEIVEFRFSTTSTVTFLNLNVWQAEPAKLLWEVNLQHFPGNSVVYGDVPKKFAPKGAALRNALQVFPENKKQPEPMAKGAEFLLLITYGYDYMVPSMGRSAFEFRLDEAGQVSFVRPIGVSDLWERTERQ